MELSERDVCILANKFAGKNDRRILAKLTNIATEKNQIYEERIMKALVSDEVDLPEGKERMQILDDWEKSMKMLNSFCESIVRRTLDGKYIDSQYGSDGKRKNSSEDAREN